MLTKYIRSNIITAEVIICAKKVMEMKVVVYKNISSADMHFFLAAGYEPIRGKVLKLIDGYYIYDDELDNYAQISEVA